MANAAKKINTTSKPNKGNKSKPEGTETAAITAVETAQSIRSYSNDVAKASEGQAKDENPNPNQMSHEDRVLYEAVNNVYRFVVRAGVDNRAYDVAIAVTTYLNERARKTNAPLQVQWTEITKHMYELVGYKPGKHEAEHMPRSMAFEALIRRGTKMGVLNYMGYGGFKIKDERKEGEKEPVWTAVAPNNTLYPEVTTVDPRTNKKVSTIPNADSSETDVTMSAVEALFNKAFPGKTRQPRTAEEGDKGKADLTDKQMNKALASAKMVDILAEAASRLGAIADQIEQGYPIGDESWEQIEALQDGLDMVAEAKAKQDSAKAK